MFSQFRHAVENLAPQPRRDSESSALDGQHEPASRSRSLDSQVLRQPSPLSSSQLAESALSNLRKSFATQRSGSPGPGPVSKSPPAGLLEREHRLPKSNLEERLRATFAIGEASSPTTPHSSTQASPSPACTPKHLPLSPSSTPLPESPVVSPSHEVGIPPRLTSSLSETPPEPPSPGPPLSETPKDTVEATVTEEPRHPEADIPLPPHPTEEPELIGDILPDIPTVSENRVNDSDVDILQQRLKLVEQRFADVSTSFKRLQAEKIAADSVICELTPLQSLKDPEALRDYLRNLILKTEVSEDEVKRLNAILTRQEDRISELRDTHRLESASQSDQIEILRKQALEAEALLKTSRNLVSQAEGESTKSKAEISRLQAEVERSKGLAKEEEEKRVKAISLLKTVRQKLVKAEKEKEDAFKEAAVLKERERGERENELAERVKLESELESAHAERDKAVTGLKAQFDRELANVKDRSEKEISALRGQVELETATAKSAHTKEIATKNSQISALEHSVNNLSRDKNAFFDQLQLRQAELESSQSHLVSLQSQNTELQYQLRESNDRLLLLNEDFADVRRERDNQSRGSATSAEDVARLLSAAEAKHESKIADLKKNLTVLERERNDGEAEWSRKLREKVKEAEDLRRVVESSAKTRKQSETTVGELTAEVDRSKAEILLYQKQVSDLQLQAEKIQAIENSAKTNISELNTKIASLEQQIEDSKSHEAQLRASNKTLREEMRKVQSSAALLERQRNPGVGYWTSRAEHSPSDARISTSSSSSDLPSRAASPGPGSPSTARSDEELNLEYLRNVILQFLEHKEMRPNLVKVLSIILRFTPQETRRLIAKV